MNNSDNLEKTEKLKKAILSQFKSIREFSIAVGIPNTTILSALKSGVGGMAVDNVIKMCDLLKLSIKTFDPIQNTLSFPNIFEVNNMCFLPVVANVRAGFDGAAQEEYQGQIAAYDIKNCEECVWFKVSGQSMSPDIKDGDFALVRRQPDVESGELAVVIYDGEIGTIKKVVKHNNALSLVPLNPEFETKVIIGDDINNVSIYGKVLETKRKY